MSDQDNGALMDSPQLPLDDVIEADDVGLEDEADLGDLSPEISQAVVSSTDWTTETIMRQLDRGNIDLSPRFQRRDAWTGPRKSRFIESLFLGLPIPQLVLAERKEQRGTYLVIDGKQRLLALRQFAAGSKTRGNDDGSFDPLQLRGLDVLENLNGLTLAEIEESPEHVGDLSAFDNQTIRTVVVKNWPSEEFLYLVFLRLNTGSVPLSPQELRQALHPGPFVDFVEEFSADSQELRLALRLSAPDFRMRDVELTVRFFAFDFFLDSYSGNLKRFLDEACFTLNDDWDRYVNRIHDAAEEFSSALAATMEIFGKSAAFSRWTDNRYQNRFNRAVFDVMTYFFREGQVRTAALKDSVAVRSAYEQLCANDQEFSDSLTATTKSIEATRYRLVAWKRELEQVLGTAARDVPLG